MKIRCIVLDMDRTTLDAKGKLSPANEAAIARALSGGIEAVIASGRSFSALPEDVIRIPGLRYAITSNGAAIYEIETGACLVRHLMAKTAVLQVLSVISEPVNAGLIACECFISGTPHCLRDFYENPAKYSSFARHSDYIKRTRHPEDDILSFIRTHQTQMESIALVISDPSLKEEIRTRLEQAVHAVYITSSSDFLVEISDENSGKHAAVRQLLQRLAISPQETAAFGDGDNDAEMLAYVGAGVAMENATENCKRHADYITARHDQNGVAQWIDHVLPTL